MSKKRKLSAVYEKGCVYIVAYETGHLDQDGNPEIEMATNVFYNSKRLAKSALSQLNPEWYGSLHVVKCKKFKKV